DESGVTAILGDVVAHPRHGPLAVHDVVGPRGPGAEAVVDRDSHPAPPGELVQEGQALLALVTDDPRAPMDVDEDGRARRWIDAAPDDVEAMGAQTVTHVVDVAHGLHRAGGSRQRVEEPGPAPHGVPTVEGE